MYFMCVCSIDDIKPFDVMHFIQSAQCIANDMIGTRVVVIKFHKSLFVSGVEEGESTFFLADRGCVTWAGAGLGDRRNPDRSVAQNIQISNNFFASPCQAGRAASSARGNKELTLFVS